MGGRRFREGQGEPVRRVDVGSLLYKQLPERKMAKVDKIKIKYGLERTARTFMKFYGFKASLKITTKVAEHREILRNKLRETFLRSFVVRTPNEENCMRLANATAEIGFVLSHYKPTKVPLAEAERLFKAAIDALEINSRYSDDYRKNQEKRIALLKQDLTQIQSEKSQRPRGFMKIQWGEFKTDLIATDNTIKELIKSRGVSDEARLCFEAVDQVVKIFFKK